MKYCSATRWLFVGLYFLFCAAQAATPERITTVEGITEYRLDNGMQVLLMPDESRPTFTINATYFVGSKHESYGESGMAHLLEHMLFYGTPDRPDIKQEISERGGWANGTTWTDRTNYFQTMPADPENLEWAIAMEADRMVNATIAAEDLETEMTVVRNELEGGENSPFGVLMQRVTAAAYDWHGYGRWTIGARSDLENVPVERLHGFYRKYYQPDNAMLVLSGNFDEAGALELVQQHFGAIPAPEREGDNIIWPTYTREPVQDGEREVVVRRVGEIQLVMAAFHVPAGSHEDYPPVSVLNYVLGDMPSGRLYKALVETEMASRVGAFSFSPAEPGLMYLFAEVRQDQPLDEVRRVLLETVDQLTDHPPTAEEVTRAINANQRNIEQTLNDSERVGVLITESAAMGDWRMLFLNRDRTEAVTPEDVARVAARYLKPTNRTVGLFVPDTSPERVEVPDVPDVAALVDGYTGREDRAAGEAFSTTAENIEARAVRFELSNGAKVALLPKKSRGGRVNLDLAMRIGDEDSLHGQGHIPAAARSLLTRGTENYMRQAFSDRMDELRATLNIGGHYANQVTAGIETTGENLEPVLEILAEALRRPVFPQRELEEWRRQSLATLDHQRTEPAAVAQQILARHFETHEPDHAFYSPDFDEQAERIAAITQAALSDFHSRFYGFGPGTTLAVVGDFDAEAIGARLEALFGEFVPEVPFARIGMQYTEIPPAELEALTPDKPNAMLLARSTFPLRDDHPDYPALVLGGRLLGGGFLEGRVPKRLRDEEGISYGAGGGFNVSSMDEQANFFVYAMYNPENRERLRQGLMEELELALAEGFGAEELAAAKRGWAQQQEVIRGDDSRLARQLNGGLYLNRDTFYQEDLKAKVLALSADEIVAALRRYLDPSKLSFAEAGDFGETAGQ